MVKDFYNNFMKNQTYLVSTTSCELVCANVLFSFDEIIG